MSTDLNPQTLDWLRGHLSMPSQFNVPAICPDGKGAPPVMVVPSHLTLKSLEPFMPPQRIKQEVSMQEVGSFVDYVNRFKNPDTLIFADISETGASFVAIIDYHTPPTETDVNGRVDYCQHVVKFTMIETPEWRTWKTANRNKFNQVEFATWLEDNAQLLVEPQAAGLLELVRSLHGHKSARFNTALRLDNGSYSVSYDEDVSVKGNMTTTSGEMELPPVIEAGIPVFQGGVAYRVKARLKTRVSDRSLSIWFETIALHAIVRDSILEAAKTIGEKTQLIPLLGSPWGEGKSVE